MRGQSKAGKSNRGQPRNKSIDKTGEEDYNKSGMKARSIFLSLEARGKFAEIAVANVVRGIQILKKKKDPIDRKSPGQIIQRRIYAEGRRDYYALRLTERDKTSFSRQARMTKIKLNPFQMWMQMYLLLEDLPRIGEFRFHVDSNSPARGKIYVYCEAVSGTKLLVGVNRKFNHSFKYFPIPEIPGTGKYEKTISDLISREKYYFVFHHKKEPAKSFQVSGIYFERTK